MHCSMCCLGYFHCFCSLFLSLICEELDRPKADDEDKKSGDTKEKENENGVTEKRKNRGEKEGN